MAADSTRYSDRELDAPYRDNLQVPEELPRFNSQRSNPAPGETAAQHAAHANYNGREHRGLDYRTELILFYCVAVISWAFEIASAATAPKKRVHSKDFIAVCVIWLFTWAWAWLQTAVAMVQRASWVRDESNLKDRRQFLYLSVRLQRLMLPTAIIAFVTFLVAYTRRHHYHDVGFWLIFLLLFIINTVGCVMNAYNNIGWECERLHYEEGQAPMKYTRLAMLGIPS